MCIVAPAPVVQDTDSQFEVEDTDSLRLDDSPLPDSDSGVPRILSQEESWQSRHPDILDPFEYVVHTVAYDYISTPLSMWCTQ